MQLNTMLKLGSLALNVAQDEKVRELFDIVHKGARRRGLLAPMMPPAPQQNQQHTQSQKPVAPQQIKKPIGTPAGWIPFGPPPDMSKWGGTGLNKYLTVDNAKKAVDWAATLKNLLAK